MKFVGKRSVPTMLAELLEIGLSEADFLCLDVTGNRWKIGTQTLPQIFEQARRGNSLVLVINQPRECYADDFAWHAVIGFTRVSVCDYHTGDLMKAVELARSAAGISDPLAIRLYESGFDYQSAYYSRFTGEEFPDLCVDVEGTLLTSRHHLRSHVWNLIETEKSKRPITIWTAGDLTFYAPLLRRLKVPYKLIPKEIMYGTTVAKAIDNMSPSDFSHKFGVNVMDFRFV